MSDDGEQLNRIEKELFALRRQYDDDRAMIVGLVEKWTRAVKMGAALLRKVL